MSKVVGIEEWWTTSSYLKRLILYHAAHFRRTSTDKFKWSWSQLTPITRSSLKTAASKLVSSSCDLDSFGKWWDEEATYFSRIYIYAFARKVTTNPSMITWSELSENAQEELFQTTQGIIKGLDLSG